MPRWLTQVRLRLRSVFHGERVEQELREEMRYHLERLIEEGLGHGLSLDEARVSARRRMGPITQSMEGCRDILPSMHVHRSSTWIVGGFAAMAFSSPTCVRYDFRRSSVSFEHTDTARELD